MDAIVSRTLAYGKNTQPHMLYLDRPALCMSLDLEREIRLSSTWVRFLMTGIADAGRRRETSPGRVARLQTPV
jgi:hypothetical protein